MSGPDKFFCMVAAVFITVFVLALGLPQIRLDKYAELAQSAERCPTTFSEGNFEKVNHFEYFIYSFQCDDEAQEIKRAAELQKIAEIKDELATVQQARK
ncbi:hypothetical protein [Motilimonas eburnea]|uniref:hypothetical protein n=1 Tax=Motilimonas eburnea TaxID=1737488 RepID=UPI001E605FAD|nr:hypothetical protein [Motilimonas eburnea]MCE2571847.1 hypothetical protein [Motilimonas eburnea]